MSVPSRQFLIQQSVLKAALSYDAPLFSAVRDLCGINKMLDTLTLDSGWVNSDFCRHVRKEYSLLASRYQERNAA